MKILQMIPATGWFAEFRDGKKLSKYPLTCWALVEYEKGETQIEGMVHGVEAYPTTCSDAQNFVRFIHK